MKKAVVKSMEVDQFSRVILIPQNWELYGNWVLSNSYERDWVLDGFLESFMGLQC